MKVFFPLDSNLTTFSQFIFGFMAAYRKGANAERELIHKLFDLGFSVARIAGSGSTSLPSPDIIALTPEKRLAIECKFWNSEYLHIPVKEMEQLSQWAKRAGTEMFVAWKIPNKGWFFLGPDHFNKTDKNFIVSKKTAMKKGISLLVAIGKQKTLSVKG